MKISKRIFSMLLALVMMLSLAAVSASADSTFPAYDSSKPNLVIGTVEYTGGGNVTVPISVGNNPGLWGANFQVEYDSSLTFVSATAANASLWNTFSATVSNNVITILFDGADLEKNYTGNGVLLNLTFTPSTYKVGTTYPVSFVYVDRLSIINVRAENLNVAKEISSDTLTYKNGGVKCVEKTVAAPSASGSKATAGKTVTVVWPAVANATGYKVERQDPTGAWTVLFANTKATSIVDTGATAGGTYVYRVTALNGNVSSAPISITVNVMNFNEKPVVKAVKAGKKKITVTLKKKVAGADGYQIKVGTNKKVTKGVKKLTTKKIKNTIKKLKSKKTYYVKVRSYKLVNGQKVWGKWSAVKKANKKTK